MTINIIPSGVYTLEDARSILNNNFGETETRLQGLEVETAILDGAGVPSNSLGNIGDYYINSDDYTLWKKNNLGSWISETSLAGTPGPPGQRGYVGLVHRTEPSPDWQENTTYNENDAVRYRGSYWRAKQIINTTQEPTSTSTYWEVLARGLYFVGPWSTATQKLRRDDVVTHAGNAYVVKSDFTTAGGDAVPAVDTTRFSLLSEKGAIGNTGAASTIPGPTGPMGTGIVFKNEWNTTDTYNQNDAVSHRGSLWVAKQSVVANSEPTSTNTTNWIQAIRGFNPVATEWLGTTAYKQDDLVRYNGTTYRVLADAAANATLPPNNSNFAVFAAKGDPGTNGTNGTNGAAGAVGPPGPTFEDFKWYHSTAGDKVGTGYEVVLTARTIHTLTIMTESPVMSNILYVDLIVRRFVNNAYTESVLGTISIANGAGAASDANRYAKLTGLNYAVNVDDKLRITVRGVATGYGALSVKARAS